MKYCKYIIVIILAIALAIYCAITYDRFFEASLIDILVLLVTFLVGTYFVEKNSTETKIKEKYEKLLDKFENAMLDRDEIPQIIAKKQTGKILLCFKRMNNIIDILKSKSKTLGLEEDIKTLEKDYKEFNDKVSTHITSPDKIDYDDLERLKTNIENKCDDIRFKLL